MMNCKNCALDIIVVAGQSNAEGNGICTGETIETRNDVFEMIDANDYDFDFTDPNKPFLKIVLPIKEKIQIMQERFCDGVPRTSFAMSFVDEFKKSKYYDPKRKIMVIYAAVGGTGFYKKEWGIDCFLYKRLLKMTDYALSFNKDNRIVALLWHQGECDAFENKKATPQERHDFYYEKFMEQTNDYLKRYSQFSFPVIMGEFCDEWADKKENCVQTEAVEKALYDCSKALKKSAVVATKGLKSNNQEIGNGDDIHFSKKSLIEIGKRYFEAFANIEK